MENAKNKVDFSSELLNHLYKFSFLALYRELMRILEMTFFEALS